MDPGKNRAGKQKSRERRTQAGLTPKPHGRGKAQGCLGDAVRLKAVFSSDLAVRSQNLALPLWISVSQLLASVTRSAPFECVWDLLGFSKGEP